MTEVGVAVTVVLSLNTRPHLPIMWRRNTSNLTDILVSIAISSVPPEMPSNATSTSAIVKRITNHSRDRLFCWIPIAKQANYDMLYTDELISAIKGKMTRGSDGLWYCSECDYKTKYSTTLTRHIEAKHLQTSGFECSICAQFCPTRNSLMSHQYRKHDVRYAQS